MNKSKGKKHDDKSSCPKKRFLFRTFHFIQSKPPIDRVWIKHPRPAVQSRGNNIND